MKNIKIFVLEDEAAELEFIARLFEKNNILEYSLFTFYYEFLNRLDKTVDVIILDHKLSTGMDGLELMPRIKRKNANCFIIILSGDDRSEIIKGYLNSGADRYILKHEKNAEKILIQFVNEGIDKMMEFNKLKEFGQDG